MEGEGVRLCVGIGLSVSEGVGELSSVEVFLGDGSGVVADVAIAVTASVSLKLVGIPSELVVVDSQAAPMKITTAVRNITLLFLVLRYAINKHVSGSNSARLIR
jgi:hypothetical protein